MVVIILVSGGIVGRLAPLSLWRCVRGTLIHWQHVCWGKLLVAGCTEAELSGMSLCRGREFRQPWFFGAAPCSSLSDAVGLPLEDFGRSLIGVAHEDLDFFEGDVIEKGLNRGRMPKSEAG